MKIEYLVTRGLANILLAGYLAAGAAQAQDWPAKPTRLIVGMPAGGSSDILARMVTQRLSERLGQPFIVENRAGANSNIGAEYVAKAAPDGYTLAFTTSGPLANNRYLYKSMGFDSLRDFVPVVLVAEMPLLLVVGPKVPASNLRELVALARSHPGKLNGGSSGQGAINHLTFELFKQIANVDMVHIPFKGSPARELLADNIQALFSPITTVVVQTQAGKFKALALTARERFPGLPDVPTAIEQGVNIEASTYYAVVAPTGTPPAAITRVNQEVNMFLESASTREKLTALGAIIVGGPPERVRTMIDVESKKWRPIIESTGVKLD